ncbi:MAG TPA: DUF5317 domain-containing protein [Firmicutes bacterium]|nr:DUF5317 domain-containing protein [Bacillota bacterium]
MLLIPGLLAYIIGKIRKGRLRNLAHLPLQKIYLFYTALLLQVLARTHFLGSGAPYLIVLSYLVLLFSLGLNIRLPGMPFIFLGTLLNALVIFLNGGQMPVALELLDLPLEQEMLNLAQGKHTLLAEDTRLFLLADIIPLKIPSLSYYSLYSAGDLFQMAGVFLLIVKGMGMSGEDNSGKVSTNRHKIPFLSNTENRQGKSKSAVPVRGEQDNSHIS